MMEAVCSSEMFAQRLSTTRRNNPEDHLYSLRRENLKFLVKDAQKK
jgi:hypothetical protein